MPTTIAYSNKGGYWKTKYTWFASFMEKVGRKFFTSSIDGASTSAEYPSSLVWKHNVDDDNKRTNYYDQVGGSGVSVSFNDRVSSNKIYKSISLEGTSNIQDESFNTFVVNADNNPAKQFSMGRIKDKGGILYGHIGMSNTLLDGSNIEAIGTFKAATIFPASFIADFGNGPLLVFQSDNVSLRRNVSSVRGRSKYILMDSSGSFYSINGAPITSPLDQTLNYDSDLFGEPLHLNVFTNVAGNTSIQFASLNSSFNEVTGSFTGGDYEFNEAFSLSVPTTLLEITPQEINGAPPRGQYAQADIVLGSQPYELYSINVNYEPTDLDHSK
jgi:hypothetical protein